MLQIHSTSSESKVHSFPQLSNQEGQEVLQQDQPYIITELILIQEFDRHKFASKSVASTLPNLAIKVCVCVGIGKFGQENIRFVGFRTCKLILMSLDSMISQIQI